MKLFLALTTIAVMATATALAQQPPSTPAQPSVQPSPQVSHNDPGSQTGPASPTICPPHQVCAGTPRAACRDGNCPNPK